MTCQGRTVRSDSAKVLLGQRDSSVISHAAGDHELAKRAELLNRRELLMPSADEKEDRREGTNSINRNRIKQLEREMVGKVRSAVYPRKEGDPPTRDARTHFSSVPV